MFLPNCGDDIYHTDFKHSSIFEHQIVGPLKTKKYNNFPGGPTVKNVLSNAGNLGSIPGREDPLEEGMAIPLQYSFLENPMDREFGGLQSIGSQRVGYN